MSQGYDTGESYIKEQTDIRDGLTLRREYNRVMREAKEFEESGKNIIYKWKEEK